MRTRSFLSSSLAAAVAAASGCGDNLDGGHIEVPPVAVGRTITGDHVVSFRNLDRALLSEYAADLWSTTIEAHAADGDSWRVLPGTGHRDGSFEIPDVPEGPAWVRIGRRPFGESFYWTDADHLTFEETVVGAEEPPYARDTDRLAVTVDGLAPWADGDALAWFVPDDHVFNMNLVWELPPGPDETAVDTTVDWAWRPLADVDVGDPAHLVQYRTRELAPGVVMHAPLRAAQPVIHQQAGIDGLLSATLVEPPALSYRLAWALDAFEAERTTAHPTRAGESMGHGFALVALPGHVDGDLWLGEEYPVATLADPSLFDGAAAVDFGEVAIPNPYPRSWLADLYVVTFPVEFPLPDGTPVTLEAVLGRRSAELTATGPARPLVTAIRSPRIAGRDGFVAQSGVGLSPEISWQAPATGTATSHRLQIIEGVTEPPLPYRPGWYIAAELVVPGDVTTIRVPADVLRPGATYGIVVRTFGQPGQDVTTRPLQVRGTAGFADAIIGPFTP